MLRFYPYFFLAVAAIGLVLLTIVYSGAAGQPEAITGNRDADGQRLSLEDLEAGTPESFPVEPDAKVVEITREGRDSKGSLTMAGSDSTVTITGTIAGLFDTQGLFITLRTACDSDEVITGLDVTENMSVSGTVQLSLAQLLERTPHLVIRSQEEQLLCTALSNENGSV